MSDISIYFLIAYSLLVTRDTLVDAYKISYYETLLIMIDKDISHVNQITFFGILKVVKL